MGSGYDCDLIVVGAGAAGTMAAGQAARCGGCVLLVNPYCADADAHDAASGGAACFRSGRIESELPAGSSGMLTVEV